MAQSVNTSPTISFLATVKRVYLTQSDFKKLEKDRDFVSVYNNFEEFAEGDARFLGAIEIQTNDSINTIYAFPFDKNNITYPIEGETVVVINIGNGKLFWLPYSNTQYPNYRQDYATYQSTIDRDQTNLNDTQPRASEYSGAQKGIPANKKNNNKKSKHVKPIYEKIKYIEPSAGDTIISGRAGNTIRFTQNLDASNKNIPSPAIIIRNRQNSEIDGEGIGFLAKEDINKDGSSIYLVSNETKVPFDYNLTEKNRIAFKQFPTKLDGDQIFINSDRIVLSAKAKEFIIFGKGNAGVITDGRFSVDCRNGAEIHSAGDIVFATDNDRNIILNASNGGNILIGSDKIEQARGNPSGFAPIQHMVMGEGLVKVLEDILTAISQMQFATPSGPTPIGSTNVAQFNNIKKSIKDLILSNRVWISKQ